MKSILIIKKTLAIGGSETLAIRMCNWLIESGVKVYLLVEKRPEKLSTQLNIKVNKITYKGGFLKLHNKKRAKQFIKTNKLENIECIYGFNPLEFVTSIFLGQYTTNSKIMIGVYHKNAYNNTKGQKIFRICARKLLKIFPEENILFMNEPVRMSHKKILNHNFKNAKIWPLPLVIPSYKENHKRTNKIISVGNFKRFKTYNLTMIDVVRELVNRGYEVEYEIYGEGPMRKKITEKIERLRLSNYIHLQGQVSYERAQQVIRQGFAFVGLGTAVLEAASYSVPAITCVSYSEKPISFGFVSELTEYNVGTPIKNHNYKNIIDLLEFLLNADDSTYEKIRKENYQYVMENFELNKVMEQFEVSYKDAEIINYTSEFNKIIFLTYLTSVYYRLMSKLRTLLKSIIFRAVKSK